MKLGIVITGLGTGGAEKHLLKILPRLKIPLFVISLTNDDSVGKLIEKEGIKIYYLGLRKDCLNIFNVIYKFKKIIKKETPTLLNSYLIHANLFTRIFGRMFGVKKIICSVRNKHINKPILMFIDKITSGLVNLYLPNSKSVAKFLIIKKIPKSKIVVLPNGINPKDFSFKIDKEKKRKNLKLKRKDFIITNVGSLLPKKDHKTLIDAIKKMDLKNIKVLFIGDGDLKKELKNYIKKKGLIDKFKFLGKRDDVLEILKITDLFVLSSTHEGMSNALLEAIASNCKILVSDIEENREVLAGDLKKVTFKVGNSDDLAKKLKEGKFYNSKLPKELIISDIAQRYSKILHNLK